MAYRIELSEARVLADQPNSCVIRVETRQPVAVSPAYIGRLSVGVREVLDAEVGRYSNKLGGVVLAYDRVQLHASAGYTSPQQPWLYYPATLTFYVFKPSVGAVLEVTVNKKTQSHTGFILYGAINGSVHHPNTRTAVEVGDTVTVTLQRVDVRYDTVQLIANLQDVSMACAPLSPSSFSTPISQKKKRSHKEPDSGVESAADTSMHKVSDEQHTAPSPKRKKKRKREDSDIEVLDEGPSTELPTPKRKKKKRRKEEDSDVEIIEEYSECVAEAQAGEDAELHASAEKRKKKKKKHKSDKEDEQESVDYADVDVHIAKEHKKHKRKSMCLNEETVPVKLHKKGT